MALDPRIQRLSAIVDEYRAKAAKDLPRWSADTLRVAQSFEDDLLRIVFGAQGKLTGELVRAIRVAIDAAFRRARFQAYVISLRPVLEMLETGSERQAAISEDMGVEVPEAEVLTDAMDTLREELADKPKVVVESVMVEEEGVTDLIFRRETQDRGERVYQQTQRLLAESQILRVAEPYREIWANSFTDNWQRVGERTAEIFARAEREGLTVEQVQEQILATGIQDLRVRARVRNGEVVEGDFVIRGHMSPEAWAHGFVRARFTELTTREAIRQAIAAGLRHFANLGVLDDRQSDECYLACQLGAITLEEWLASEEGPPPRHVLHCRCGFIGVVDAAQSWRWKQPNPFVEARLERRRLREAA